MRAHTTTTTTTTMSRRRRRARRRAIALAVCSLAIPASATAQPIDSHYSSPNAITGGSEQSSQPAVGSGQSSLNAITQGAGGSSEPSGLASAHRVDPGNGYSSLNATTPPPAGEPTVVSSSPSTDGGFDWLSAVIGAGAAMALGALGGAVFLTVRRQRPARPSPAGTS